MIVAHCVECNKYKYIESDGKCRNCIKQNKLYIGKHNGERIFIKKNLIYRNINISGVTGSGKTTVAKQYYQSIYG